MPYQVGYFHPRVLAEIESWPVDVLADYARPARLLPTCLCMKLSYRARYSEAAWQHETRNPVLVHADHRRRVRLQNRIPGADRDESAASPGMTSFFHARINDVSRGMEIAWFGGARAKAPIAALTRTRVRAL